MAQRHYYTDEQKEELLSNPYTARITNCSTVFTLAFKQFVMENVDKPNMTSTKIFRLAGYRDDLFSAEVRRTVVLNIRREAATKEGLQEPKPIITLEMFEGNVSTDLDNISQRFDLQADLNDLSFVRADYELDLFLKYGASLADDNFFLIIHNIDLIDQARQVNWFGLAKNRSIRSLDDMLEDIIVIFTISSIENVNKIEYNFWNFGHNFIY